MTMAARQRILAALNHEPPDRTPTDGWFHPEVMAKLKQHFGTDDRPTVLKALGIEGWASLTPALHFGAFEEAATLGFGIDESPSDEQRMKQAWDEAANQHQKAIWLDENTYEDAWGIRWGLGEAGRYVEWLSGPLDSVNTPVEALAFPFPDADEIREPDDYASCVAKQKGQDNYVACELENPFKRYWHLRGYENALMDYVADQEILEAVYDRLFALGTDMAVRSARAGVDMVKFIGDVSMQDRMIMSPELWRKFDKPRFAAAVDAIRKIKPDIDLFFHSDGKLTDIVADLIEIGFNVINPIQPECMDPTEIKKQFGDRITLHGCISLQQTLPFGTVADVRNEVETLIRQCGYNGGLVAMPSNVIQPDTPVENVVACFHTARDLEVAGLRS